MSGGVDSSVTACLLKEQGYDVIGIHLWLWTDNTNDNSKESGNFLQNKCCTLKGLSMARMIAARLDIPFYVLDFEECFKKKVVDYFIDGYGKGVTPNPCVECNRHIKFGLLLGKMKELGADFVATGHYVRKVTKKGSGRKKVYELWAAKDKKKDQSYFLYVLTQEKLKHILFPLGDYTKTEVRQMAKKYGIDEVNKQQESQDICFYPEKSHVPFLKRHMRKSLLKPGPIITTDGKAIGIHKGLPMYTIGQRKGLEIGGLKGFENQEGNPWYVIRMDTDKNALIVGKAKELLASACKARSISFIGGEKFTKPLKFQARIRYHAQLQPVMVYPGKGSLKAMATVKFDLPQRAVTPGQSIVFYDGERVAGGGIIAV